MTAWTHEQEVEHLLRLPWTVVPETTPEGDRLLRIAEIPAAVGTGTTPATMEADLWEALRAALLTYLHYGDPVPMPGGVRAGWLEAGRGNPVPYVVRGSLATPSQPTASGVGPVTP